MWKVQDSSIFMTEGDYGIALPVTVSGATLGTADSIKFTFKSFMNGEAILEKVYDSPVQNTVNLEFTASDSAKFRVGKYLYSMDWYQNGSFLCNIIPAGVFKVVDKA